MSQYLVVYSIGPVQSFIARARKTEDLWSGSYLLSELVGQAMNYTESIIGKDNVEWIQPNHVQEDYQTDRAENPNRFLFFAKTKSEENLKTQLNQLDNQLSNYMTDLTKEAVKFMFNLTKLTDELETQVETQMSCFLELFWSFQPYDKERDDFDDVRSRNESNLASVKNNRLSRIRVQEGLACSVCNNEDALSAKTPRLDQSFAELKKTLDKLWKPQEPRGEQDSNEKIKKGERLCSACTLKRMLRKMPKYRRFGSFPSVRVFSTFGKNSDEDKNKYKNKEVVDDDILLNQEDTGNYYAMLMFDGDDMGKWVSNKINNPEGSATVDSLKTVTRNLSKFSTYGVEEALKGLPENSVKVIYSGGDDVLALGATKPLIKFVSQARRNFSSSDKGLDPKATASCGIVIAPEKEPLQQIVAYARKAESKSKNYKSEKLIVDSNNKVAKNAFTIHFVRNSGNQRLITLPFKISNNIKLPENLTFSGGEDVLGWILKTAQTIKEIELSRNYIYQFRHVFEPLSLSKTDRKSNIKMLPFQEEENIPMVRSELVRLIYHSSVDPNHSDRLETLINDLTSIYFLYEDDFTSYIHLLEIIQYFSTVKEGEDV